VRARILLLGLVAFGLAACGGSSVRTVGAAQLSSLVLGSKDVGSAFASFNNGPQVSLDNAGTVRADPQRYGREGGWIARYHRGGSPSTLGPLVIESRADVFKDTAGAKTDLRAYSDVLNQMPGARPVSLPGPTVGEAAVGVTFVQASSKPLRFYRLAWRDRNVTASVLLEGFNGKLHLDQALALARKQERLIAAR
jgi:hypothetical protein